VNNDLDAMSLLFPTGIVVVFVTVACSSLVSKQQILEPPICPVPTQQCVSEPGAVPTIDTGLTDKSWYYEIAPVVGINTPEDEWAVLFWGSDTVYATVERKGKQQLQQYWVPRYDRFRLVDNLILPYRPRYDRFRLVDNLILPYRHYGSITVDKQRRWAAYAAVAPQAFRFDSDLWIAANAVWEKAQSLPINQQLYLDSHPALDPEGKVLFFASDRGDTIRGTERFYRTSKRWGLRFIPFPNSPGILDGGGATGSGTITGFSFSGECLWRTGESGQTDQYDSQ